MATYKERVAALKKAGEETKKKHAEGKKAKRLKKAYKKEAGLKWYEKAPKDIKEKAAKKSKAKETGEVRRGAKGVKSTKGGEYAKYGKKSKAAKSFKEAFKAAEGKNFTWDGRSYSGKTADDVKKEKAAKVKAKADAAKKTAYDKKEAKHTGTTESGDKYSSESPESAERPDYSEERFKKYKKRYKGQGR